MLLAKPLDTTPSLLVIESWGIGDVSLAVPFLRLASARARVTLLAKPHAEPILRRFAPAVSLIPFDFPWTGFDAKYRLHAWPWRSLFRLGRQLRADPFDLGVGARPDPRDHLVLRLSGARKRIGFSRFGSRTLLSQTLPLPDSPHRKAYWSSLAHALGWPEPGGAGDIQASASGSRRIALHPGAARSTRRLPIEHWKRLAQWIEAGGWNVVWIDDKLPSLDRLIDELASCERFLGNDSGPGHLAALLGIPTFTVFGPQLPSAFAPDHPQAAWADGGVCEYKPCFDRCRYAAPHCLLAHSPESLWPRIETWLNAARSPTPPLSRGPSAPN